MTSGDQRRPCLLTLCIAAILVPVAACQTARLQGRPAPSREAGLYLVATGWHTGLALPVRAIRGPLRRLLPDFPRANYLLFGWGERGYYMVILVTPLERPPQVTPDQQVFGLGLSTPGFDRIADFVWAEFDTSIEGAPRRLAGGLEPGSAFYAATRMYSAAYTCNTWTADALRTGGLPMIASGTVFAHQVTAQVQALPRCIETEQH